MKAKAPSGTKTKACTEEEIKAYQAFSSLSLDERRRRVYQNMVRYMPDSPVTRDFLIGRIQLPKRRGRKQTAKKQRRLFK